MPHRRKLILDVDTGTDDAHAIMLALSNPSLEVIAITCANGNVTLDKVAAHTLRTLQACDRLDVPVYKGAARSLLGKVSQDENANDGPAWKEPVDLNLLQSEHAVDALLRLTREFPGEITLMALAPLTNIALALNLDPDFPNRLRDVVIMGGSTDGTGCHSSPCSEFNFFYDAEAAYIVLNDMKKVTVLPFDTCVRDRLSWDFVEKWTGGNTKKSNFIRDSLGFDVKTAKTSGAKIFPKCDAYAVAMLIDPSIITKQEAAYVTVELSGQHSRAGLIVDWDGVLKKEKNATLIMGIDMAKIQNLLLTII